jgi:hypothetical protein
METQHPESDHHRGQRHQASERLRQVPENDEQNAVVHSSVCRLSPILFIDSATPPSGSKDGFPRYQYVGPGCPYPMGRLFLRG